MKFRLDQLSYIDNKLVEVGTEIELAPIGRNKATGQPVYHVPGPHWKAVDDEAKKLCEALGTKYTGEVPDMVDNIELRDPSAIDYDKLGAAIGQGVVMAMEAMETRRRKQYDDEAETRRTEMRGAMRPAAEPAPAPVVGGAPAPAPEPAAGDGKEKAKDGKGAKS